MKLRYIVFILLFNSCVNGDTSQSKSFIAEEKQLDKLSSQQQDELSDVATGVTSKPMPAEEKQLVELVSQQQDQLSDMAMGVPYMGDYKPTPLLNYKLIPKQIRNSVEKNIVDKTGEAFFKQLRYIGGGFVNLDSLYAIEKNTKNYKWKPSSYYLCFELRDSVKGITYCATIETDVRGNITKEIEFPNAASYPYKTLIISKQAAIKIAVDNQIFDTFQRENNGIYTEFNLKYDEKRKILVWECTRTFDTAGHSTFCIYYHNINAHNGRYLGYNIGIGIH